MTRRVYLALVADPLAAVLVAVVDVAGVVLDRTADVAEAYAGHARWLAVASRCVP